MRTTNTLTISLPPAMVKQMERVQKEEHRTRKGRAAIKRGEFVTLQQLLHDLDNPHRKAGPKRARESSR